MRATLLGASFCLAIALVFRFGMLRLEDKFVEKHLLLVISADGLPSGNDSIQGAVNSCYGNTSKRTMIS